MNRRFLCRWRSTLRSPCGGAIKSPPSFRCIPKQTSPPIWHHFLSTQSVTESSAWKQVYREFLLAVHPDFFHEHPSERATNEKNLKIFQQHLQELDEHGSNSKYGTAVGGGRVTVGTDEGSRLVFFLKPDSKNPREDACRPSDISEEVLAGRRCRSVPRKVILPLNSHSQMATLLHEAGITATAPSPAVPPPPLSCDPLMPSTEHSSSDWVEELFGDTAANKAWYKASYRKQQQSTSTGFHGSSSYSRQREARGPAVLGHVLSTDAGRALVRERRASARNVQKLVEELQKQYGFGEFTFRCGWSKSNLTVALASLIETCGVHRETFGVHDFDGLEVVFTNDPSVLNEGEIQLCPADVPLEWVSVLKGVTPSILSQEKQRAREVVALEQGASAALKGARLSKGLSCSKSRYRQFLWEVCEARADFCAGESDWSGLRCRVEEGSGRLSKVLEDGSIQVGSDMTPATLWRCLGRDYTTASSVAAGSARLAAVVDVTAARCQQSLGLEAIHQARAVSFSQMKAACDALIDICGVSNGRGLEDEVGAARRRLRGHCVRIVSRRLDAMDGLTEEGEIAIPWDWAKAD